MKIPSLRAPYLLLLGLLVACTPQRPMPQATAPTPMPTPVRNEAIFVGDLHGEALLFDLRREDLDDGPVGAIDVERPRAAHVLTLIIEADGPFLLEARDAHGALFRHAADASDRLTLPARRGRIEFAIFPRGDDLTRIRAIVRYGEDLPPQGDLPPLRPSPRAHVEIEPLPSPDVAPRLPESGVRSVGPVPTP